MIHTMNYVRPFLNNIFCLSMLEGCEVRIFCIRYLLTKAWKVAPFQALTRAYKLLDQ
jgi:hypothetical protein